MSIRQSNKKLNIPNTLTVLRILSFPIFIYLIVMGRYGLGFILLLFAGLTDVIDGVVARVYNQRTTLGSFLDPAADKLLLVSSYIAFAQQELVPLWLTSFVITRDILLILLGVFLLVTSSHIIINPSFLGKCTTFTQITTILLSLLATFQKPGEYLNGLGILSFIFYLTGIVTVLSGIHYLGRTFRQYERGELRKDVVN